MKPSINTLLAALVLAAATGLGGFRAQAAEPSAAAKSATLDETKAANLNSTDIAEGKRLADAFCASCHGTKGISSSKGVPHLAGQRPSYLRLETRAYMTGTRGSSAMETAVKFLSEDAVIKVSAYYATLEPPSAASAKAATANIDPIEAGKAAASGCGGCHGENGNSKTAGVPNLSGEDPKALVNAMKGYKSGGRKHDMMKTLLAAVTEPDMNNIALYYGLQKVGKAKTPSPGDQAAGKTAAADCGGCHGDNGVSGNPATPSLAGQDAEYITEALKAYKKGARSDDTMKALAGGLDEKTMKNLGAYYANLQPQQPKVKKPLTLDEWAQRCDRCHGLNGNSTDPKIPALAAQRADYLDRVLRAYQKGDRKNTTMAAMSSGLTDSEIEGLASHYATQKARAVVFMSQTGK